VSALQRAIGVIAIGALFASLLACSSGSGGRRRAYYQGSIHYNSFPGTYQYMGPMGYPR